MSVVADEIEFEFDHSQHCRLEHILEEEPLLGMHHLVIAVFKNFIAVNVFDVEMSIKAEPFFVFAFVGDLSDGSVTCPLAMF